MQYNAETVLKVHQPLVDFVSKNANKMDDQSTFDQFVALASKKGRNGGAEDCVRDKDGNVVVKQCKATGLWFAADAFGKGNSASGLSSYTKVAGTAFDARSGKANEIVKTAHDAMLNGEGNVEQYQAAIKQGDAIKAQNLQDFAKEGVNVTAGGFKTSEEAIKGLNIKL